jgi:hypothetical protein
MIETAFFVLNDLAPPGDHRSASERLLFPEN